MNKLRKAYNAACNAYLKAFCEKHGYDYEDAVRNWDGDDVGGITEAGDYMVAMADIITDIDREAAEEEFGKWYDYCLRWELATEGAYRGPNYESWLKGRPHRSDEKLERVEALRRELHEAIDSLKF